MALIPTTPANEQVPATGTVAQDLDTFHITEFIITVNPNDATQNGVVVRWDEGYMSVGVFVPVHRRRHVVRGAAFNTAAAVLSDGTKSHYANIKAALWQLLIDEGQVAGTVS